MKKTLLFGISIFLFIICNAQTRVQLINPFVGTGGHGHTHPAASAPFGMVQVGPDTRLEGWDGCSGYHYTDTAIYGFSHTHLSGTGVADYNDILFRPITDYREAEPNNPIPFKKSEEQASAGHYSVKLDNGVFCEFTATPRTGIHRYTFPDSVRAYIFVDLGHRDKTLSSDFIGEGPINFEGHRFSQSWAENQKLFFSGICNKPYTLVETAEPHTWIMDFGQLDEPLEIYVALSSTGTDGATANLKATTLNFETALGETQALWDAELEKTQVEGGTEESRAIFATALYHAYLVPNLWSDVDGSYRGMDDKIHRDVDQEHYTIFSLWDTYRALHPLFTITQPQRTSDFINTMLDQYEQSGRLPVWELAANETSCMIGYHSVSVIADAVSKGYPVDTARVLEAMDKTATADVFGLDAYRKKGFLSVEDEPESVSKTLEYAYDDACIFWAAHLLGDTAMSSRYAHRASAYRSVLHPRNGLVTPRSNGGFLEDYDPKEVNNHFTEANSWQYSFAPVHDIDGWLAFLGDGDLEIGREKLEANLDRLFSESANTTGRTQADITGLIGQYAHGNEPSHHVAFLYNLTRSPHKAQERVSEIRSKFYTNAPDGLIGNEDCGQMSAWYVLASMGLYPIVPGKPVYAITTPVWDESTIQLPGGKELKIRTSGSGDYIAEMLINNRVHEKNWVVHSQLLDGGLWEIVRSETPTDWGTTELYSNSLPVTVLPAPEIDVASTFQDSTVLRIEPRENHPIEVWKKNGEKREYKDPITVSETTEFYARYKSEADGNHHTAVAKATKKPTSWNAEMAKGNPSPQYYRTGDAGMVDGVYGELDWRKGNWIGAQGQDIEIILERESKTEIQKVRVQVLKDIRSWIALPGEVIVSKWVGNNWLEFGRKDLSAFAKNGDDSAIYYIDFKLASSAPTSKLKVELINTGTTPKEHLSPGAETFIFVGEIEIY